MIARATFNLLKALPAYCGLHTGTAHAIAEEMALMFFCRAMVRRLDNRPFEEPLLLECDEADHRERDPAIEALAQKWGWTS